MIRRLSTKLGINKSKTEETNGTPNGAATNGSASAAANGPDKPTVEKRRSSFLPLKLHKKTDTTDHSSNRSDVDTSFEQFAQLIHASQRPLPTQGGDGSYIDHAEPSSLLQDVKALGFKDAKTLIEVMKTKAAGELQDDKTYIMERTIQVSRR